MPRLLSFFNQLASLKSVYCRQLSTNPHPEYQMPSITTIRHLVAGLDVTAVLGKCVGPSTNTATAAKNDPPATEATSPVDATYTIEGEPIRFDAGRAERQAA